LGKDDLLRLLVAQLRNQDPLDPLDHNEFIAQTAQFTSLEHLMNISQSLEAMRAASAGGGLPDAAALLGRTVGAAGREWSFDGVSARLPFALDAPAASVGIEVLDRQGTVRRRLVTEPLGAGSHEVTWDGLDEAGQPLAAGTYFYRVAATGGAGEAAPRALAVEGVVSGLSTEGTRLLYRIGDVTVRQEDLVGVR
jgi:flagellar basal-body rod modification protein FlgD